MNDLQKLFLSELRDMYDGEKQLVEALPEMEESAHSHQLKSAFRDHLLQTKNHVTRLENVFRELGETPKRKTCQALEGIIDEGQLVATEFAGNSALDAGLIAAGQKAEHYEITAYGSLCAWARELGYDRALTLLEENLGEEKEADQKLTALAESLLNTEATRHDTDKKSEASAAFRKVLSHGT